MTDTQDPNLPVESTSDSPQSDTEGVDLAEESSEANRAETQDPAQLSDHTTVAPEIQAQQSSSKPSAPASKLTRKQLLSQYIAEVTDRMTEREHLKLTFVDGRVPEPYFNRWIGETNRDFALLVRLKRRRTLMEKKAV